jgi:tRNA(Ile)-lysidine synthase
MLKAFQKYIQSKSLFVLKDKILLAISGGVDSMVMLHLFKEAGCNFQVAHCNFKLRDKASDMDEEFLRKYCKDNHIICHFTSFDTQTLSKEKKLSIEETARNLRYSWFEELLKTNELNYIATAHHKNDVSETMLLNLSRGTGIGGLHGIMPKRDTLIRPMLFASKLDIENYAQTNQIKYVFDQTNNKKEYTRNKIRHELIPLFNSLNPDFINSSNLLANYVRETESLLKYFVNEVRKKSNSMIGNNLCIDFNKIDENILNQTLLFELIRPYGFNSSQNADIYSSIGKSGLTFHSKGYDLVVDRKKILIKSNSHKDNDKMCFEIDSLPFKIEIYGKKYCFDLIDRDKISEEDLRNKKTQYINFDLLKFPLLVRSPKEGEKFSPFGLKGSKKISDYLTDRKLNLIDKHQLLGLYQGELIALLGLEIDNMFAIKNTTQKILKIEEF